MAVSTDVASARQTRFSGATSAPPRAAANDGRVGTRVGKAIIAIFVIFMVLFILGPLVWLAVHAFATNWTYPNLLPDGLTLRWWEVVFSNRELGVAVQNSLFFAPITVLISALICLPAAYAFARFQFFGRKTLLLSLFATNAFPKMGLFVAIASLFYTLNLMGSIVGVLIIHVLGTIVFMTWIPAAAFASVPRSLEEAARDAGASKLRVFFSVTFPMALPGILVAIVMSFLASFDEAQGTYLVGAPDFYTMPTQMYTLVLNYPKQVAAVFSILLSIPSLALILAVRKHIMGGQLAEGFQLR